MKPNEPLPGTLEIVFSVPKITISDDLVDIGFIDKPAA